MISINPASLSKIATIAGEVKLQKISFPLKRFGKQGVYLRDGKRLPTIFKQQFFFKKWDIAYHGGCF
ncbi:hypothetical protein DF182_23455 [Chitinophaga flava]|uniref:Uncharacterized protein n=1 Tax=Chitinophaga flava TaxID=2259036 RepID=A0A365XUU4_9BACT|nr:hypothetical protein DF182_23455 [Chitinophaga flava]